VISIVATSGKTFDVQDVPSPLVSGTTE